jgi:hypothetical protein
MKRFHFPLHDHEEFPSMIPSAFVRACGLASAKFVRSESTRIKKRGGRRVKQTSIWQRNTVFNLAIADVKVFNRQNLSNPNNNIPDPPGFPVYVSHHTFASKKKSRAKTLARTVTKKAVIHLSISNWGFDTKLGSSSHAGQNSTRASTAVNRDFLFEPRRPSSRKEQIGFDCRTVAASLLAAWNLIRALDIWIECGARGC